MRYTFTILILGTFALIGLPGVGWTQEAREFDPSTRAADLGPVAREAQSVIIIDPDREITVSGDTEVDNWLVTARVITFEPGARLIFSERARATRDEFYIVAEIVRVAAEGEPPVITWAKPTPGPQPDRGQASSGPAASGAGSNGNAGANGDVGSPGVEGVAGPSLTLVVKSIEGAGFVVNMSGSDGGPGGKGQRGGTGSDGAQGTPARNEIRSAFGIKTAVGCEAGPGKGGDGGNGGGGGRGGEGGLGGRGGNTTIISLPDALPTLTNAIRVNLSGGQGGAPGAPGEPGEPGAGAPEGPRTSWCGPAGRNGARGGPGAAGSEGPRGQGGQAGDFYVGSFSQEQFERLFGF